MEPRNPRTRVRASVGSPRALSRPVWRALNALAKLSAGLPLRGENVSPEVRNDLFQAHLAIYFYAAALAPGARILDLGCGTGYGSAHMLASGAREVVGIDQDELSVRYARRRYRSLGLTFVVGRAESLDPSWPTFDLVVASNILEHLTAPATAIRSLSERLMPIGRLLAAVPPITDEWTLRENERNPYHRSNLFVGDWLTLFEAHFGEVQVLRQVPVEGTDPDFANPAPSKLSPASFRFLPCSIADLADPRTLGALFLCSHPTNATERPSAAPSAAP